MSHSRQQMVGVNFNERLSNSLMFAVALLAGLPTIAAVLHMVVKIV